MLLKAYKVDPPSSLIIRDASELILRILEHRFSSCRERSIMVYKGRSETKMAVKHKLPSLKLRNFESTRLRLSNSTYNYLFYLQLKNLFNRYFHFSVYKQAWQVKLQPSASTWERRFPVSVYFNMEKWKSSPTTKETERRPATSPSQTQKD